MADPFSIIAGVIGAAAAAVHTGRRLKEFLDSIKDTPETVKSISKELGVLQCSLITLDDLFRDIDDISESGSSSHDTRCIASLETILVNCQEKFRLIHKAVLPFVKDYNGTKRYTWKMMANWIDRKGDLEVLRQDLVSAKITLDLGVSIANLIYTRTGLSQLQNQFNQLNTRLEEASEDNVSDVGSSSVVTDLGFALRRFLKEHELSTAMSDPYLPQYDDGKSLGTAYEMDDLPTRTLPFALENHHEMDIGHPGRLDLDFTTERSSETTTSQFDDTFSPLVSPLSTRFTSSTLDPSPSYPSPTISRRRTTSFEQPAQQKNTRLRHHRQSSDISAIQTAPLTFQDNPPRPPSPVLVPPTPLRDDIGWDKFQISIKATARYFRIPYQKLTEKGLTSMLNFGIVVAAPISHSPAYADRPSEGHRNYSCEAWNQIFNSPLYRHSSPIWCLKPAGHGKSAPPSKRGVTQVHLSKVITNGCAYEFIRLFLVVRRPSRVMAYDFGSTSLAMCNYVGNARRLRDIKVDSNATETATALNGRTTTDTTPISVLLSIRDDDVILRLKTDDGKTFLDPKCARWTLNPALY